MSTRKEWVRFITDENASRFLYLRGSAQLATAPTISEEQLSAFWETLANSDMDSRLLLQLHFLTSQAVQEFMLVDLREILRTITGSTSRRREVSRRGVRGKVDWARTSALRASGRGDNATFSVIRSHRSQDLPENRLLKLFLHHVLQTVRAVEGSIGSGALIQDLERIRDASVSALRSTALKDVTRVETADALMRQRARRSRDWRYSRLVRLHDLFEDVLVLQDWQATYQLVRAGWFEPVKDDDLFELFALVLVLDVLEHECGFGDATEYGLIAERRSHVAQFEQGRRTMRAYFDQSPTRIAGLTGAYRSTISVHVGLSGVGRRPDVTLQLEDADSPPCYLLLEIKRSEDGRYQSDSVYKAFGYLYDFSELWEAAQRPKLVLLFPTGVESVELQDLTCVSGDDRSSLAAAVGAAFGLV